MFVVFKKKNILLIIVLLLAVGFIFTSIRGAKTETTTLNSWLAKYLDVALEAEEEMKDDLEMKSNTPLPVIGNPLEIGTQIEVPISANYFMEYKLERDRIRSRQIDILREIVNNPNSISENRMEAQQRLFLISDNLEKELELESLLAAKGFTQTVALIQPNAVTIVIGKSKLSQEEIAKITDLAVSTTSNKLDDVIIIPLQENSD